MPKSLSTFAVGEMLHVDPGSVANWVDQDLLKAHRTPGGHRRVRVEDLLEFLREHNMPIPQELDGQPPLILVVDDEPAVATMIAHAIRDAHPEYEVLEANDGFQAGTLVATRKPEVVLLDLRMPGINGFDVCRQIKSQEETRSTHVIAMTAYPLQENTDRILACGARTCLTKPLEIDKMLAGVAECLKATSAKGRRASRRKDGSE